MPTRVHAVIVGAGLMGRWHARASARAHAHVSAIVDPDISRARDLARHFPGCLTSPSLGTLNPTGAPTVVHVCTPTPTHAAIVHESLARGSHVLVEKPLAQRAQTTAELLQAAQRAGVLLCPVHQFVFQRGVQQALARLEDLGELLHLRIVACSAGAVARSPSGSDDVAIEILPHPLSLIERFAPGALGCLRWSVAHPRPGELVLTGSDDRRTASCLVSMHGRPTSNEMTLIGTRGTIHLDLFHGFGVFESGTVSRATKIARPFQHAAAGLSSATSNLVGRLIKRQPAYPGLWELVSTFYRAAEGRGAAPFSDGEILAVAEALESITRSAISAPAAATL